MDKGDKKEQKLGKGGSNRRIGREKSGVPTAELLTPFCLRDSTEPQ